MKIKTVGIVANLDKSRTKDVAKKIVNLLQQKKINVILDLPLAKLLKQAKSALSIDRLAEKVDVVITLGGDGTFLRVARVMQKHLKPILGVNLGGLGFLAEVTLESLENDLGLLVKGQYDINYRMTLYTDVVKKNGKRIKVQPALNDVVVSKKVIARIINVKTYINNKPVTTFKADGVIVATPTGSTAYTLSAGGPIVHPKTEVVLISPICPHTLTHRPLVIPSDDKIKLKLDKSAKGVILTVDGQIGMDLSPEDSIIIKRGQQMVPLITFRDTLYFKVLQQKLSWGSR